MSETKKVVKKNVGNFDGRLIDDIVVMSGLDVVTSSLKIAEVFGKEHFHVLRDIRAVIADLETADASKSGLVDASKSGLVDASKSGLVDASKSGGVDTATFVENNFIPAQYIDAKGEKRSMYNLTFLVMGYTGTAATRFKVAYITAFNRMRDELYKRHVLKTPSIPYTGDPDVDDYTSMCCRICREQQEKTAALYDELDTAQREVAYYKTSRDRLQDEIDYYKTKFKE